MPKYTAKQYAKALFESVQSTDKKDIDKVLDNFAKVLSENNDLRMFEQISEEYHNNELEHKGIKPVEVVSAHTLDQNSEKQIVAQLNDLVKQNVEIRKKVDEGLIGGVVIKFDDQIIDASVKNSLDNLKNNLSK